MHFYFTTTVSLTDANDNEHTVTLLCSYDSGCAASLCEPAEEPSVDVLNDGGASDLGVFDTRVLDAAVEAHASGNYTRVANPFKAPAAPVAAPVAIAHECYNGCRRAVANRGDECKTCIAYRARMNTMAVA